MPGEVNLKAYFHTHVMRELFPLHSPACKISRKTRFLYSFSCVCLFS